MAKLIQQFPRFGDTYVGITMRAFIRQLEIALGKVQVNVGAAYTEVTSTHIVTSEDSLLIVDTTGGSIVITLPLSTLALVNDRFEIIIKKKVSANTVTINKTGTDTVDSGSSLTLTTVNSFYRLRAVTGGWISI